MPDRPDEDDEDDDAPGAPPEGDPFALQRQRAAETGGFLLELQNHVLTWLPGGGERLVVCFDNLASVRETRDRTIWGQKHLLGHGFDLLGVQIKRKDWFRDAELIGALQGLQAAGFFRRFPQVSMYGASMGAFGALAFAPLAPGCTVLAFAPQRSLDLALCPFETRYRYARSITDWSLPFSDAAAGLAAAGRAYLAYDPQMAGDRRHVEALAGPNVTRLPLRHFGHKLPPALLKMGVLKDLSLAALENRLTLSDFARLLRARRQSTQWQIDLLTRARRTGHQRLALPIAQALAAESQNWRLRRLCRDLIRDIQLRGV